MDSGIPNLLIRTVSDLVDSSFSHVPPKEVSPEHDHSAAVSFRKGGGSGGGNGGSVAGSGGGSPLSLSPRSLHLEVKERKDASPRSIRSNGHVARSGSFRGWGDVDKDEAASGRGDELERNRVLSLGIWTDDVGKMEIDEDLGQVFELDGGEQGRNGFNGAATAVGVSQG